MVVGIDVSKYELAIFRDGKSHTIKNEAGPIKRFLKNLPEGSVLGLESTGGYGLALAEAGCEMGFTVYIVAPKSVKHYRQLEKIRAKTDRLDAEMIARFVEQYREHLWPFVPMAEPYKTIRKLARQKMAMSALLTSMRKCMRDLGDSKDTIIASIASMKMRIDELEKQISELLSTDPRSSDIMSVSGVGEVVASMALPVLQHFKFKSKHSFVAYMGSDLTVCESGKHSGRRRMSHDGDAYLRWAFFTAALAASRSKQWRDYYKHLKEEKGLKPVQALCALARKLARVVYGVYKSQKPFNAELRVDMQL
jgi:transposase